MLWFCLPLRADSTTQFSLPREREGGCSSLWRARYISRGRGNMRVMDNPFSSHPCASRRSPCVTTSIGTVSLQHPGGSAECAVPQDVSTKVVTLLGVEPSEIGVLLIIPGYLKRFGVGGGVHSAVSFAPTPSESNRSQRRTETKWKAWRGPFGTTKKAFPKKLENDRKSLASGGG